MHDKIKLIIGILLACGLAVGAAVLASVAKAEGPPKWTGCYLSAGLGVAATNNRATADLVGVGALLGVDGLGSSGRAVGVGGGCDLQIQQIVVGVLGDYTWHDQGWSIASPLAGGTIASMNLDTQWMLGGRAGIVVGNALVYGLIGYTELEMKNLLIPLVPVTANPGAFKGVSVGGGIEMGLGGGFFLGAEYRFSQFDKQTLAVVPGAINIGVDPEVHSVQAKLLYKFNFEVPKIP